MRTVEGSRGGGRGETIVLLPPTACRHRFLQYRPAPPGCRWLDTTCPPSSTTVGTTTLRRAPRPRGSTSPSSAIPGTREIVGYTPRPRPPAAYHVVSTVEEAAAVELGELPPGCVSSTRPPSTPRSTRRWARRPSRRRAPAGVTPPTPLLLRDQGRNQEAALLPWRRDPRGAGRSSSSGGVAAAPTNPAHGGRSAPRVKPSLSGARHRAAAGPEMFVGRRGPSASPLGASTPDYPDRGSGRRRPVPPERACRRRAQALEQAKPAAGDRLRGDPGCDPVEAAGRR